MKVARDFKEIGYCALALAIIKNWTVNAAVNYIENKKIDREDETYQMYKLKEQGLTYKEIANKFNYSDNTVYRRIKKFKEGADG